MRVASERAVFTVTRHDGMWAVEHGGEYFGHSRDKEVAKAAANKRVRQLLDSGRACLVRVMGEHGFYEPAG